MLLANSFGSFIFLDENIANKSCMDITRIMVRVPTNFKLMENMNVMVEGVEFRLVIREDSMGSLCIYRFSADEKHTESEGSTSKESWAEFGGETKGEEYGKGDVVLSNGITLRFLIKENIGLHDRERTKM